jgi:hypothetical protein
MLSKSAPMVRDCLAAARYRSSQCMLAVLDQWKHWNAARWQDREQLQDIHRL